MADEISRRAFLGRAALLTGVAIVPGACMYEHMPPEAVSKHYANYQAPSPLGGAGRQCGSCTYFVPEGACRIVEGVIRPEDWCRFWTINA